MNYARGFPCPGIDRQISPSDDLLGVFKSAFALDSPIRHNLNEIPLSLIRKTFGKPSSRIALPRIELKSLLKALRCSNRIRRICAFRVIDPQ